MSDAADHLLEFDEYADAIADAAVVLRDNAARSGLDAAVPTCPGWTVQDLLVHQGSVHRWATAALHGERLDVDTAQREGAGATDLLEWLGDGVDDLLRTLDRTPEDHPAWFFLADAPPARLAWARRQCHETTIHAVDAMTTSLGHPPTARQVWFGARLATDGIDELLTGFLPRESTRFRPGPRERVLSVVPHEGERAWSVRFTPGAVTSRRCGRHDVPSADTTLVGSAVDLYLALWNRDGHGQDVEERGEPILEAWSTEQKVTWR